ncbi:hypothetical protein C8N35_105182 [Breoghania corrubedonensis]|uniref:Uncharacterized protein n=1 Tax=Breoghania corrubedonensis TaxID=665038 RepID=A0A2T5V8T9_9HYPH|nr:hypothetical protein [Breoghania corrubedonensis]PTW60179.1 hypothetical protein C8N35_105182 [Breoghania corrubedonensis]
MISYLVDAALMVALVITSVKMIAMYRELKRLGGYHADYQRIFDQTTLALDGIEVSIQEINVRGAQVLNALGSRMDDARGIIADIETLMRDARKHQAALRSEMRALQAERERQCKGHCKEQNAEDATGERKAGSEKTSQETVDRDRAGRDKARLYTSKGNRLAVDAQAFATANSTDMRVQRIDDSTYAGSFRSVCVGEKDTAK